MIDITNEKKVDILLHYDKSFREDWRFLHRLRVLVASFYIGIASALVGWVAKISKGEYSINQKIYYIIILVVLSVSAIVIMAWFGSSINTLKRFMVKIERELGLMKKEYFYTDDPIVQVNMANWGQRNYWNWGKGIFAAIIITIFYSLVLLHI